MISLARISGRFLHGLLDHTPQTLWIFGLVFLAVTTIVWAVLPVLIEFGDERRRNGRKKPQKIDEHAMSFFTTPNKLARQQWTAGVAGGGLAISVALAAGTVHPLLLVLALSLGGGVAFQLPLGILTFKLHRRRTAFASGMMDLTLGLTNGLKAGASFSDSLQNIARRIGGPMAEELNVVLNEYRCGMDMGTALQRLCQRMPNEDLKLLMTAVRLTMKSGGSLSEVLQKITETIRRRTEFQQKLKTMTAQGRFEALVMSLAPVVVFCLMYLVDSELMTLLFKTTTGWFAIAVVLVLELCGFFWIWNIVTIKV